MSNTEEQNENVRIRRAPKIPVFIIMGGGLGAIVAFILTASQPIDPEVGFGPLFGYFALYGITGGVLLGAVVALVLDWASSRRARTVSATVVTTPAVELPDAPDAGYSDTAATSPAEEPLPEASGTAAPDESATGSSATRSSASSAARDAAGGDASGNAPARDEGPRV